MLRYTYNKFAEETDHIYRRMNEFCLECNDCCSSYAWLMQEEVSRMIKNGVKTAEVNNIGFLIDSFAKDRSGMHKTDKVPTCRCYNKGLCSCYDFRPMYCRLYPLIIRPLNGAILLQWDTSCNFIRSTKKKKLIKMQKEMIGLFKKTSRALLNSITGLYETIYKLTPTLEHDASLLGFSKLSN